MIGPDPSTLCVFSLEFIDSDDEMDWSLGW